MAVSYYWGFYLYKGGPICQKGAQHDKSRAYVVKGTPTYHCALGPALAPATKGPYSAEILQSDQWIAQPKAMHF